MTLLAVNPELPPVSQAGSAPSASLDQLELALAGHGGPLAGGVQ